MFEIFSVLIIFSRSDVNDKLLSKLFIFKIYHDIVLFDTYCYTEGMYMTINELRFMLEKLITVVSSTLSIKRAYLHDIFKAVEVKLIPSNIANGTGKEKISQDDFMNIMTTTFREVTKDIDELSLKISEFSV